MRIDIITVLPEMIEGFIHESILARAQKKGLAEIHLHNLRDYTLDKWRRVDDYPYGGFAGMVMQIEPIDRCISALKAERDYDEVIFTSPDGEPFNQHVANDLSLKENIIILCGHYKGVDQRVRDHLITREISVGDYVLTGGELPAAIIADAVVRVVPGVIGDEQSALSDCFQDDLLAAPIYTRPADYKGWKVPDILLSGHEAKIKQWEMDEALRRTRELRPDLLGNEENEKIYIYYNMNKITDNIYYIGADDRELDLFEGQYETPEGISYNSHVIMDEKIAVLDTIDERKTDEWKANLAEVLGDRKPDYLIVSHMEPDHSSLVKEMIDTYPEMKVVCSMLAVKMMTRFFGEPVPADRLITVKDNSTLELGEHTLQFFTASMVHWPEVIVEYEQKEKILFSADAFGKFGALSFDDPEGWACEARRYYFNIVGKYGAQVQALLKKLSGLEIKKICPLHGPILDENLEYYLNTYNTWS